MIWKCRYRQRLKLWRRRSVLGPSWTNREKKNPKSVLKTWFLRPRRQSAHCLRRKPCTCALDTKQKVDLYGLNSTRSQKRVYGCCAKKHEWTSKWPELRKKEEGNRQSEMRWKKGGRKDGLGESKGGGWKIVCCIPDVGCISPKIFLPSFEPPWRVKGYGGKENQEDDLTHNIFFWGSSLFEQIYSIKHATVRN